MDPRKVVLVVVGAIELFEQLPKAMTWDDYKTNDAALELVFESLAEYKDGTLIKIDGADEVMVFAVAPGRN